MINTSTNQTGWLINNDIQKISINMKIFMEKFISAHYYSNILQITNNRLCLKQYIAKSINIESFLRSIYRMKSLVFFIILFGFAFKSVSAQDYSARFEITGETNDPKILKLTLNCLNFSYGELRSFFGYDIKGKITVRIIASDKSLKNYFNKPYYKKVLGVTLLKQKKIILRSPSILLFGAQDYRSVIAHELCHIFISDITGAINAPVWLHEGLSMYFEPVWYWNSFPSMVLPISYLSGNLIPFSALARSFPPDEKLVQTAYIQSKDFIAFLIATFGMEKMKILLRELRNTDINSALIMNYGNNTEDLEELWRTSLKERYNWVYILTQTNFFWFAVSICAIIGFVLTKIRRKKVIARMASEESADVIDERSENIPPEDSEK